MASIIETEDKHSITYKAGRGIFWNFLTYGLSKGVLLLTTSILARLLTREDFGLVAVAVIAINYLSVVKDLGLGRALIQRRQNIEEAASTVFTINAIIGFVLSLMVFLLAPVSAAYFEDPMVTPVLRWLGVSFAINALGSVHMNLLTRDLDYRRRLIPDFGNTLIKGVVSIGMAFSGFGVWSLVFGQIAGGLASVVLVWVVLPWRPRIFFDKTIAGQLMKFGASITGVDILFVFADNLSYLVVGKVFGMAALGVFSMAYRLPEMLIIGNLWVMTGVIFPAFSSIQDKPDELRRGFLVSIRLVQLIVMPLCLGLFIAAEPIVMVVFGEQWLETIPLLRILAIFALVYSVGYHVGDVYKAIGRPDILLKLNVFSIFVSVPALLIGSLYGLTGIVWGYLIGIILDQIVTLYVATKFVSVTFRDIFNEIRPAAQAALLMVPVAFFVSLMTEDLSPFIQLTLVVISGGICYLGVVWWLESKSLLRLAQVVLSGKK
ncbi:MAG: lipopolysaccharide biosynthesis protein [Anaerolineales bacterium]|nr:lipopolysaccharide biosynthesis protein [Anaerolineales bacterium]WKZ39041.1 MAG: lipopolysaccharide biosynthesis protein [Anaerolineales bacterium]